MFDKFATANQRYFNSLEEMPVFTLVFAPLSARLSHMSQSRLAAYFADISDQSILLTSRQDHLWRAVRLE